MDAAGRGASDIHLHPAAQGLDVLYRLDGILRKVGTLALSMRYLVVNKIKILAGLQIQRRDIAQEGKILLPWAGGEVGVRVSILPAVEGEKAVLRIFQHLQEEVTLEALGFEDALRRRLTDAVARPDGLILLTGPSGSGKTTTIYTLLRTWVEPCGPEGRHIVTIEDPVEHVIPGITQIQVNPASGITFACALRAILRQDPNVIAVGEIRDWETAKAAVEASLSGHLVISTVHTGTAVGVVGRLLDMGVDPQALASSLTCVLAQRLVRVLCLKCCLCMGERFEPVGCPECSGTGYRGRRLFAEYLEMDDPMRVAVLGRKGRSDLQELAEREGLIPLRQVGQSWVRQGITSRDELFRVMG